MNLSPHFSLAEFTDSQTAERAGIDNDLPADLLPAARDTAAMLERIRAFLSERAGRDVPLRLSSGYRCLALNRKIGSQDSSDHVRAAAADLTAPAFGTPFQVARALAPHVDALGIGQLIAEFGKWVHVSARKPAKAFNRIITYRRDGVFVGIVEG